MEISTNEIDEGLYSRQLYVMGHEAMKQMAMSDVLIIGLNGLGVEASKNVILAGVKSVTLYDPKPTEFLDLSSQFFLTENDIGKPRAEVSAPKLAELNPYVPVKVFKEDLNEKNLAQFTCIVMIDSSLSLAIKIGDFCHQNNIRFIMADTFGVIGGIFCDFGPSFTITNPTGESPTSSMIAAISNETQALITVEETTRHNLESGDYVTLQAIEGLPELNGKEFQVSVRDPFSFTIDFDTTNSGLYQRNGYVNQVFKPVRMSFQPLSQSIKNPGIIHGDVCKMDKLGLMHFVYQAIHLFRDKTGFLPRPDNFQDAEEVFSIVNSLNNEAIRQGSFSYTEWDSESKSDVEGTGKNREKILRLAVTSRGNLSPVCSLMGGILGQEILKACSGKFTPINQWFYYDCYEALPLEMLPAGECVPIGSRYDGQIVCFGKQLQQKLCNSKTFLVGAGAIGCEMLKNWAMMGVGCGDGGLVHITDMDHIEKSNLSRQFLFRSKDIQCPKSFTAASAVCNMNPSFKVKAYENKVAPDTEHLFDDDFYESLDFVCTALDNVEARLYVDQQCLFYQKPLLESGTLGTKGHTQIVVPCLTENYGASRDPPEKSIPVCTLKNFPNQIEHTLQWSRDWFEGEFKQTMDDCNMYLTNDNFTESLAQQQNLKLDILKRVHENLVVSRPVDFRQCVLWSRMVFEDLFTNRLKQLIHSFPLNSVTSSGTPFWSGAKKPPLPLLFDQNDPLHLEFIQAVSNLRAKCYGLPVCWDDEYYFAVLPTIDVPIYTPSSSVKIAVTEEEAKAESSRQFLLSADVDSQCSNLLDGLQSVIGHCGSNAMPSLLSIDFEKDDDDHMRVITACSNLRARNYKIPEADLYTSRGIAGKIIPAIATTTALVVGVISMELYKILQNKKLPDLSCMTANIAINQYVFQEPNPPKLTSSKLNGKDFTFSSWDRIDIEDPQMTLLGLMNHLESKYNLTLSMLSYGVSMLFSDFMPKKKSDERKNMRIVDIIESVTKKQILTNKKYLVLELIVNDIEEETDDGIEIPYVRFKLR